MVSMMMSVMTLVAMAVLILELMLHRIRDRRTRRRAEQCLEFTALADLVAQRTTRAAAYDGSDEALFTVALLLLITVGWWWCAAVLCLSWWCVAAHVPARGGGILWLLGCIVAVGLLLRVGITCAVVICC